MKALGLGIFVYLSTVLASALPKGQVPYSDVPEGLSQGEFTPGAASEAIYSTSQGRPFVEDHGILYELVRHSYFADHQLRVTEPSLCDPSVKQYAGYLDITDDKHLFFWKAILHTVSSSEADVVAGSLSSSTGLLFELGPCSIADNGTKTVPNPYSWNEFANIIFLDQPVNVGFSYAEDGSSVNNSPLAGKDVYAFLELFLTRFPEYSELPFHLAAESYGGTYGPNIAKFIFKENQKIPLSNKLVKINMQSIILGNGLTDSAIQYPSIPDYLCEGPYPLYPDPQAPECTSLRQKASICHSLVEGCYSVNSPWVCTPAALYCAQLYAPIQKSGLNPYDARRTCDPEKDGPLCYKQMSWIENYMNTPEVKAAIGANPQREFQACNMAVNQAFLLNGDGVRDTPKLLPALVNNGIRLLVYAGVADMMCNYIGQERWLEALDTRFLEEFLEAPTEPWFIPESSEPAGTVRSAGGQGSRAGNVTFVAVYEAGHMVPYDQPKAALDLIERWVNDVPLMTDATL